MKKIFRRYAIIDTGDKHLLKAGLTREILGPAPDGGPMFIAACPTQAAAELVKRALENLPITEQP